MSIIGCAGATQAQSTLSDVTTALSAPISLSETTKVGARFSLDWTPYRYDFAGPWTGATDYILLADRASTEIYGWAGQYSLNPADLLYPVGIEPFVPELSVYMLRAECAVGDCISMSGRRLGWDGPVDWSMVETQESWPTFDNNTDAIIFAVASCEEAYRVAGLMEALLESQGATPGPAPTRTPCPDTLQLALR